MITHIEDLIYRALTIKDNNIQRSQAQAEIFQIFKQNTSEFLFCCASIVGDEDRDSTRRQATASIMKTLLARKSENNQWFWDSVLPDVRVQIKSMLLATLISPEVVIMRSGANVIAQIAVIEISRNEWLEIVNTLAQNAVHQDQNIRRASITTLGFICQECKAFNARINNESCEQILGCLLMGLCSQGREIVEISLNALRDSIQFLKIILDQQVIRDKTMQILFRMLENETTRSKIYEILYEFGRQCYPLVQNYLNPIIQFTIRHMQERDEHAIEALELWDTIGSQFVERQNQRRDRINADNSVLINILQMVHTVILPQVMACILIINKNDIGFAELRESAVKTLGTFVQCGNREIVQKITEGVSRIIQSSHPGQRQASALLFGCLCEYEDKEYIKNLFSSGFTHLFVLLSDSENIVRKNTLNGFVTLSQSFGEVFLKNSQIRSIFNQLVVLSKDVDEDTRILSLTILSNITQVLKDHPNPITQQPQMYLQQLVALFRDNLKQPQKKQSNEKLIVVLMNLIMVTQKRQILYQLIKFLIEQYNVYSKININDKQMTLELIMGVVHTCVLALEKFANNYSDVKDRVFELIDNHIKNYGLEAEAINMISAAALSFKKDFKPRLQRYWNLVAGALENIEQKILFKAALSCISDLSRIYETEISHQTANVFNRLLNFMYLPNIDREIKTEILRGFGDLQLGLRKYGVVFIQKILQITSNCYEAISKLLEIESEKIYAEELKDALIEMYHCVMFAVNDQGGCNEHMAEHFPVISSFIVNSCDPKYKPTVDYLRNCLYLIYDSGLLFVANERYRVQISRIIQSPQVQNIVESVRKYRNRTDINDLFNLIDNSNFKRR